MSDPAAAGDEKPGGLRVTALTVEATAAALSGSGSRRASAEVVRGLVAQGAPQNGDGTLSLIELAAWLLRQEAGGH